MWCRKLLSSNQFYWMKSYKNVSFRKQFHTSSILTAGHSKWANIRHIKALKDGQKSVVFTKYSRMIRLAIQEGGSADPALNSTLRSVMDDAMRKNMPMATIQNSIKKSDQSKTILKKQYLFWRYQQKVFAVCILYTDNFAQLKQELASLLRKYGTVYVEAQHIFDDVGIIEAIASTEVKANAKSADELEQICTDDAIECGVEEVEVLDHATGAVNFMCNPVELGGVARALKAKGYLIESSEHVFIPKNTVKISEEDMKVYHTFLKRVREIAGIEEIFDNLEADMS